MRWVKQRDGSLREFFCPSGERGERNLREIGEREGEAMREEREYYEDKKREREI